MPRSLLLLPFLAICSLLILVGCEDSETRAERHFVSALDLLEEGDVDRALIELRNVIKYNDQHKGGRLLLAKTLERQGETDAARNQYTQVVEQFPDLLDARIALARMSLEFGDWETAFLHGRKAFELDPQNADAVFLQAALKYREAIQSDDISALSSPLNAAKDRLKEVPSDRLAWRLVIDHAITAADYDLALQNIETALSHHPDDYQLFVVQLRLRSEQNDTHGVGELLRTMTERFPDDQDSRDALLSWYIGQDDVAGAEAFLRDLASAPDAGTGEFLGVVNFLWRTQGAARARVELESLIAADPENDSYHATRAALDFEEGDTAPAIATMKELLDKEDSSEASASLKVNLARMYVSIGNADEAKALIDDALLASPGHVEALKMRAAWQIENDLTDDAVLTLRTAQASAPRDLDIMVLMGRAHERAGARELAGERYALAVEASAQAARESLRYADFLIRVGRIDLAESVIVDALQFAPNNIDLLVTLAETRLQQQNWNGVTRVLWQLRAQERPAALASADQIEVATLLQQNRVQDTVALLSKLIEDDANNTTAVAKLIDVLVQNDDLEAARSLLSERLESDPENPNLRLQSARINVAGDEFEQAETIYRGLLEQSPNDQNSLLELGQILVAQKQEEELARLIDTVSAAEPSLELPRLMRAQQLERLKDYEGAIEIYETLYADNSDSLIIANNLGSLLATHREDEESFDRAHTVTRRLRGLEEPAFQETYGWIAYRRGNNTEALAYLQSAVAGLPGNPQALYHLGEVYWALGRNGEARDSLTKAIELSEQHMLPQEARAKELLNDIAKRK